VTADGRAFAAYLEYDGYRLFVNGSEYDPATDSWSDIGRISTDEPVNAHIEEVTVGYNGDVSLAFTLARINIHAIHARYRTGGTD